MLNTTKIRSALLALVCSACIGGGALAQDSKAVNVPAGDLTAAIKLFVKQSGVELVYRPEQLKGLKTKGVQGTLPTKEAVNRLLEGTSLMLHTDSTGVMWIAAPTPAAGGGQDVASTLTLATAEEKKEGQESGSKYKELSQVVVEGLRDKPKPFGTANLDLTRTEDDTLPFTVFTARDVELSGATNLEAFLQDRLPQNFNEDIPDELNGDGLNELDGVNRINMRGWGATETIILLNGRRMPAQSQPSNDDRFNATPNLEGIPLASIERIEILTSAGSAIYGQNATGGIINIITRQDFKGGQFSVNYETPTDVSRPRRGMDFSYGLPFKWGTSLRIGASYGESEPLRAGDRSDVSIERWRRLALQRQPTRLFAYRPGSTLLTTTSPPFGGTPNIRTSLTTVASGANLFGAGTPNFTSVPEGYTGGGGLAAFQNTRGVFNFGLSGGSAGSGLYATESTLGTSRANTAFSLGLDKNVGDHLSWSVDYRYSRNESEARPGGSLIFIDPDPTSNIPRVPAAAPTNPFGQEVLVRLVDPYLQRPELINHSRNVNHQISSTLRVDSGKWRGFADLSYSTNSNRYTGAAFYEPTGGWSAAFLSGAYNPFIDPRAVAPASPDFYEDYVALKSLSDGASRDYQAAVKFSGPVARLPAGEIQLTFGTDWLRADRYRSIQQGYYRNSITGQPQIPVGATSDAVQDLRPDYLRYIFSTYSGYAETEVPVFGPGQNIPLVKKLELFASGRLDYQIRDSVSQFDSSLPVNYTDSSNIYAAGLRYTMLEGLIFRFSRSVGFRPPGINNLSPYAPPVGTTTGPFTDPLREEEIDLDHEHFAWAGNPDLKAETTASSNLGLILELAAVPGLRLSVDYVESVRNDAIGSLDFQQTADLEADLPGRVTRGAPDGHASGVGPIIFLDTRAINFKRISSRSLDISLDQTWNLAGGRLMAAAAASKNLSFEVQIAADSPLVEQVRNPTGISSQQIKWNANGQLRWEGRHWGVGWSARYFDFILANPADYALQGSDRAPGEINHDLNFDYRAASVEQARGLQSLFSGISVTFGIKNVFDREPRFWAASRERGVAPYDSILGRSAWLQMRKSFQ